MLLKPSVSFTHHKYIPMHVHMSGCRCFGCCFGINLVVAVSVVKVLVVADTVVICLKAIIVLGREIIMSKIVRYGVYGID